jgi:hypothetical protein
MWVFTFMELWKKITGYEYYFISSLGIVKNTQFNKEKYLKKAKTTIGYEVVLLYKKGKRTLFYVHRLVAINFIPNTENKPQVNHIDGNKLNNCIDNLEWNTAKENINHAYETGLCPKGDNHYLRIRKNVKFPKKTN